MPIFLDFGNATSDDLDRKQFCSEHFFLFRDEQMKLTRIAVVATIVALSVQQSFAAEPGQSASARAAARVVVDVALHEGGLLQGQIVDQTGAAQRDVPVVVAQNGKAIVIAKTDEQGRFAIRGLRGGVYEIESTQASGGAYRLWAPQTAPPSAKQGVVMVASEEGVVRGQVGNGEYGPAIRGAVAGGLITGGTYWALDYNPSGS